MTWSIVGHFHHPREKPVPLTDALPAWPWAGVPVKLSVVVISTQGSLWLSALTCGPGRPRWWLLPGSALLRVCPALSLNATQGQACGQGLHVPRSARALESPWSH